MNIAENIIPQAPPEAMPCLPDIETIHHLGRHLPTFIGAGQARAPQRFPALFTMAFCGLLWRSPHLERLIADGV
ncbi:hypothetical protein J27TS7_21360 [Paenibacillus dendritiformis]|uniref:hypothetical protein n=1 Tax=Paenibacillus dendritiformis TaxID=130049 RepID=UPI001B0133D8|nr:hypothetical protein [Paenibacillus dendritiformis]GIO72622.1 hypothetical protein J27TS7_21360 [Paenibacillus dendritiformis]